MSDDESEEFSMTMVEAIANHAFGDDLIYVQRDEKLDTGVVYVGLVSTPGEQIEFDWIEYWQSLDETGKRSLLFTLVEFHNRDGQL
tara:strand:+ start:228 stop:485 length:258 start_codon:yes stop_codon:yes gene_type:complete